MVNRKVLVACGIDPDVYSGYRVRPRHRAGPAAAARGHRHARHRRGRCALLRAVRDGGLTCAHHCAGWASTSTSPPGTTGRDVAASFVSVGLEEEDLHGGDITGPLVVGRVLSLDEQVQKNGKPIRFCVVDVGPHGQMATEGKHQQIVCGATNFAVGDLVVVVLPGAVLPGGFEIAARKTYGQVSNGMICAEDEIGIGARPQRDHRAGAAARGGGAAGRRAR